MLQPSPFSRADCRDPRNNRPVPSLSLTGEGFSPTEFELICHVLVLQLPRLLFMPYFTSTSFFICVLLLGVSYTPAGILSLGLQKVSHRFSSSTLSLHSDPFLNRLPGNSSSFAVSNNLSHILLYRFFYVLFSVFCQGFCEAGSVSVRIVLYHIYFKYMLWNTARIRTLKKRILSLCKYWPIYLWCFVTS